MAPSDDRSLTPSETEPADSLTECLRNLESRLGRLNDRIQSIEDSVTDDAFHWEKDFDDTE